MIAALLTARWLLSAALLLLLVLIVWRLIHEGRLRRRLKTRLANPDPEQRIAAIDEAAHRDLASTARLLLRLAQTEKDATVLAALVAAVARRQWEPASSAHIVALRLWARRYVETRQGLPEMAPSSEGGRPRRRSDASEADLAAMNGEGDRTPADRGPRHRVLVTGAGGPAGVSVIRHLMAAGHEVIAVDADALAAGCRLATEGHVVPLASHEDFVPALLDVIDKSNPVALMCTVAEEYPALIAATEALEARGVATLMPSLEAVNACCDKWRFAAVMAEAGLPSPKTVLAEPNGLPGPWVVKPRFGRGSAGVHLIDKRGALRPALAAVKDPIVQTRLSGLEFTVDALVAPDGTLAGAAPRWRLETKAGISTKGRTFDDPGLARLVGEVLSAVGLVGPANVQGFASDGGYSIVEVNPRFSGGLPLSLYAGADLVGEYLRAILGEPIRPERLVARSGVTMIRHWSEVFEG